MQVVQELSGRSIKNKEKVMPNESVMLVHRNLKILQRIMLHSVILCHVYSSVCVCVGGGGGEGGHCCDSCLPTLLKILMYVGLHMKVAFTNSRVDALFSDIMVYEIHPTE